MFASKRDLDRHTHWVEGKIKTLQEKYWVLWHKHETLLKHLGLTEHTVPEKTELRTKGEPERAGEDA